MQYAQPLRRNTRCAFCEFAGNLQDTLIDAAAVLAGTLGNGRVLAINPAEPQSLLKHPNLKADPITAAIQWLAEPRLLADPAIG